MTTTPRTTASAPAQSDKCPPASPQIGDYHHTIHGSWHRACRGPIGIGEALQLHPPPTPVHTGPYTAVRWRRHLVVLPRGPREQPARKAPFHRSGAFA